MESNIHVLSLPPSVVLRIWSFLGVVEGVEDRQSPPLVVEGEAVVEERVEDQALCWWTVAKICWKDRNSICGVQTIFEVGQFNGDKAETKTSPRMRIGESTDRQNDSRRRRRIHKKTRNEWEQTGVAFVSLFEYQHRQP